MLNLKEVVRTGGFKLPRDRYTLRLLKVDFGPSKNSGSPMITLEWEIAKPQTVTLEDGGVGQAAGMSTKTYLSLTAKAASMVADFCRKMDLDVDEIDESNPQLVHDLRAMIASGGFYCDAVCASEESIARKDPTAEQRAANQPGEPILDSEGQQIKSFRMIVVNFLSRVAAVEGF